MARKKAAVVEENEASLQEVELPGDNDDGDLLQALGLKAQSGPPKPAEPLMSEPGWDAWVLGQLDPDSEVDPRSERPLCHGLRRLVLKLLGPILSSESHLLAVPTVLPDGTLSPAVVSHRLVFLMGRETAYARQLPYERVVQDVASVWTGNTDPNFARYGPETAATRAEARAYRKALGLRVAAAEEMTNVPVPAAPPPRARIDEAQITFINGLCARCDINVMKFVNSGPSGRTYKSIDEVAHSTATEMCKALNNYQSSGKVPEDILGYDHNWRKGK